MKQTIMMKRTRTRIQSSARSKQPGAIKTTSDYSQSDSLRGNLRNNIQNSVDKYTTMAREAIVAGDRVLAESFFQLAEHYLRLSNEYKENLVVLPKTEETHPSPPPSEASQSEEGEAVPSSDDFEASIEQELASQVG